MTTPPAEPHARRVGSSDPPQQPRRARDIVATISASAGVLFSGLFAGFLITVLVFEHSLRRFPASIYTQVRLIELDHLDDLATVLLPPAILAAATLVAITIARPGRTRWLALTALLLLLATFAISLFISVPINTDQRSWSVLAPPSNWLSVRDRWQTAHLLRTTTATIAFVILTAVAVTEGHRVAGSRHTAL